ncbi:hypothetical protein FSP39_017534 [Pinctada imbricata]|uniref:Uncharacterized protein n=1 Tax=Pinctada imbricata TaxID=66713 RepID=A0AA88Y4E7_PINIB|nr:hypothetical protein FSP39_017534 [Pinctada imbricata]
MEFSYPCGLSECKYPSHFCEQDSDLLSRSRCLPCSGDICSMLGTEHFPKACTFYCNPKEALIDACTQNFKDEEKDNLLKEQTGHSGIHPPYDEQPPVNMRSLHCIVPATADNNPARNLVVPSTNRGMMESQMTDMQNILTTTVKGLES